LQRDKILFVQRLDAVADGLEIVYQAYSGKIELAREIMADLPEPDDNGQVRAGNGELLRQRLFFRPPEVAFRTNKDRLCERSEPRSYPVVGRARYVES